MTDAPAPDLSTPRFLIKGQYVKDLSFENPHSPHSLISLEEKPQIDVSVNLKTKQFDENFYELGIHLGAHAKGQSSTLFLLELHYCAIIQLTNIPKDKIEPVLMVDCAFAIFPFARRVISDVTRDGGFPPLMLEPIDFQTLYIQNQKAKA